MASGLAGTSITFLFRSRPFWRSPTLMTGVPKLAASMMPEDFLYVLGATPAEDRKGDGVFKYWDENGLWTELDAILTERFVKKDDFWVAPPQFADESLHYTGYRVGIRRIGGSWKFVYFVNG